MKTKKDLVFLLILLGITVICIMPTARAASVTLLSVTTKYDQFTSLQTIHSGNIVPSTDLPPNVDITNPHDGQTVNGTISIMASATDDGILNRIQLKIDGQSVHINTTTTSLPYMTTTFSWNTSTYTDGTHTIAAVATDNNGNNGTITITVNVLNSPLNPFLVVGLIGIGVVALIAVTKLVSTHRRKASGKSPGKSGRVKEFNPQPEPPGKAGRVKEFNPQPEPPGKSGNVKEFNPQPEPPGKNQKKMKKKKQIKK